MSWIKSHQTLLTHPKMYDRLNKLPKKCCGEKLRIVTKLLNYCNKCDSYFFKVRPNSPDDELKGMLNFILG